MKNETVLHIGRQFLVHGRVQGVFYRRFAMQTAVALGITGWARNLSNGDVEIHAFGTEVRLTEYVATLQEGPMLAKVQHISTQNIAWEPYADFQIKEDA